MNNNLKVYLLYDEDWEDSEKIGCFAYKVVGVFRFIGNAELYKKKYCSKNSYIEEVEVI